MKFKVDENLPTEIVDVLRRAGHDAMTVVDQGMGGHGDPGLAEVCAREHRALLTLDLDFSNVHAYPPERYAGIIVLRLRRQDKQSAVDAVQSLVPVLGTEKLEGCLWGVDETRVRVRG